MYKFMNNPYRFQPFYEADKGGGGASGSEAGDGGQEGENAGDGDGQGAEGAEENGEGDADEKKYSQAEVDAAVEKRLAREKRKWQREQQKPGKPDGKAKTGEDGEGKSNTEGKSDTEELDKERRKTAKLSMQLACYEAGVPKESVKDVTALAKSYMEEDEDLDFEDAIEEVLKKYPQFKGSPDDAEGGKGAWGQRQKGKGAKKEKSMEDEIEEALYGK